MAKDGETIQWQKTDRQYNGKRRTDNTMAKDGQTIQWQKERSKKTNNGL
jgi:hypothetical protein